MKLTTILSTALPVLSFASAAPSTPPPAPVSILHQFPNGTFVENIAVRSNDALVVSLIAPLPSIYQISPTNLHPPLLLATFPGAKAALGLEEIRPDVFAAVANNFSTAALGSIPGANAIWELDLCDVPHKRGLSAAEAARRTKVRKLLDVPEAQFLNGLAQVPANPRRLLASDSRRGVLWSIDLAARTAEVVQDSPLFKPTTELPVGLNGIRIRGDRLYFVNSVQSVAGTVRIDADGRALGPIEVVERTDSGLDDFALAPPGAARSGTTIFSGTNTGNSIVRIRRGESATVVGGGTQAVVAGTTSVRFARGARGRRGVLYATTTGGLLSPVDGGIVGGKVLKVDVSKWL